MWSRFDPAECRHWLEAILDGTGSEQSTDRGTCLYEYAYCLMQQGDLSQAHEVAQRSVALLRTSDDDTELAWALLTLWQVEGALGNSRSSRRACQEAIALARGLGNNPLLGHLLNALSLTESDESNWEGALRLLRESREAFARGGWDYIPLVDHNTACALRKLGRAQEAHQLMSRGLQQEARTYRPVILLALAEDYAAALAEAGYPRFTPLVLAACETAREQMGTPREQRQEREIADGRTTAEHALTPAEWNSAYARGKPISVLDALVEAVSATTELRI
jgi:tetratricopeptide (TPR) repeat protein